MWTKTGWIVAGVTGISAGWLGAQAGNKQEHALDANLYMQTSAEYRAVCVQTYNWAAERLTQKLAIQPLGAPRPAVIMDLDETVVDNAAYQSYLDRENLNYSDADWEKYESQYPTEVRLIPGAKSFIDRAESMGVAVIYLSNRMDKHKDATIQALKHVGLSTEGLDDRLLLKTTTSDKTPRRELARAKFNVVMLVGDNLRDFSEEFAAAKLDYKEAGNRAQSISDRWSRVDANAHRFGGEWVILPNPVYGEWQKPLGPDARLNLRPTAIK